MGERVAPDVLSAGRPTPDEVPPYFASYVARVPETDPVAVLDAEIHWTTARLNALCEQDALARYAPGKWSVKEVAGHLADVERIMAYRALRIARGDQTPLPGFDEKPYVPIARFDARPLPTLVADLRTVRAGTLALFRSFDADAWCRRGTVSDWPISVRTLAFIIAGHERHHVEILQTRYGVT